jgi:hypothetical protein
VTSVSLLVNGKSAVSAAEKARKEKVFTGLHLNLTEGRPIASPHAIPSLLDASSGCFLGKFAFWEAVERMKSEDIEKEIIHQIERYRELMGEYPRRIDGHQHVHVHAAIWSILRRVLPSHHIKLVRFPLEVSPQWCRDAENGKTSRLLSNVRIHVTFPLKEILISQESALSPALLTSKTSSERSPSLPLIISLGCRPWENKCALKMYKETFIPLKIMVRKSGLSGWFILGTPPTSTETTFPSRKTEGKKWSGSCRVTSRRLSRSMGCTCGRLRVSFPLWQVSRILAPLLSDFLNKLKWHAHQRHASH